MNPRHLAMLLGLCFLAVGSVAATGAFTGGDQATGGIYLNPASSDNGDQYAEIGPNGELEVELTGLNARAVSVADNVFTISTNLDRARVWIDDDEPSVTFYRMDTGAPIERSADAVQLRDGETIAVGIEVRSDGTGTVLRSVTVRAEVPAADSSSDVDPDPDADDDDPTNTPTPDTPTATPVPDDGGGGATPDGSGGTETTTAPPTTTPPTTELPETEGQPFEIAGLSGPALVAMLAALVLLLLLLGARWLRRDDELRE